MSSRTPAQARRAFLQDRSIPPRGLKLAGEDEYQTETLSLRTLDQQRNELRPPYNILSRNNLIFQYI